MMNGKNRLEFEKLLAISIEFERFRNASGDSLTLHTQHLAERN